MRSWGSEWITWSTSAQNPVPDQQSILVIQILVFKFTTC